MFEKKESKQGDGSNRTKILSNYRKEYSEVENQNCGLMSHKLERGDIYWGAVDLSNEKLTKVTSQILFESLDITWAVALSFSVCTQVLFKSLSSPHRFAGRGEVDFHLFL